MGKNKEFRDIPANQKVIFLPQCLRSLDCKAKTTEDGIICINCGKCSIGPFKKEAESFGYKVFIAPGSSLVKNIVKKYKFRATLGVACIPELKEGVRIMKKQGSFIFDNIVLMNEDDLRRILNIPNDEYDIIVAQVQNNADILSVQEDIEKLMRKERDVKKGEEDFTVQTPQAILSQVNSTLFAVQLFVYIIAGISIVVGGIGIMNTMFTSVLERTREIGIMKSIGARNSSIFFLFFIESGLIGSIGGVIGAVLGTLISWGLAYAGRLALGVDLIQSEVSIWLVAGSIMGSFFMGSIFGLIPAIHASKLNPVDALRHAK